MRSRILAAWLVLSWLPVCAQDKPAPGKEPGREQGKDQQKDAKAALQADLTALRKQLEKAGLEKDRSEKPNEKDEKPNDDEVVRLVAAFADKHRPAKERVVVLLSTDKKLCIAIGANGNETNAHGADIAFEPTGTQFNIAVGGNGFDSTKGDGGNGGTVTLAAKGKGRLVLVGGNGGKGADGELEEAGKTGGNGGHVWVGNELGDIAVAAGGAAGNGGKGGDDGGAGGTGGVGGSVGTEAPK